MKKKSINFVVMLSIVLGGLLLTAPVYAQEAKQSREEAKQDKDIENCKETKAEFLKKDPNMKSLFENSAGYIIFPNIGKGAMGVGGATGNGILFEKGKAMGKANMTQVTIGAQAGGKVFSEVIFFETNDVLQRLKDGKFEFTKEVSAVALKASVSVNMKYREGVLVFTEEKGGLMYEATLGGQKFTYNAY